MACVHHTDAQLLTGYQHWGNVPTDQCKEEPHTMSLQHSCHALPTMPDACLVHLGPRRERNKTIKALGKGTRVGGENGNPPLLEMREQGQGTEKGTYHIQGPEQDTSSYQILLSLQLTLEQHGR